MLKRNVQISAILIVATACSLDLSADPVSVHASALDADVVIYGGTPAGLSAATAVVRGHRSVIVVEPTSSIGGMITGGIAITDTDTPQLVGGIAREFFEEVSAIERRTSSSRQVSMVFHGVKIPWSQPAGWDLEPKVARQVFERWLQQQKYQLVLNERVVAVTKSRAKILSIRLTDGSTVSGKVFIDASYEGDLMAKAGVSSTFGRESSQEYGESLTGVRLPHFVRNYTEEEYATPTEEYTHQGQFGADLRARDERGHLLWGVEAGPLGDLGSGDDRLQAYCYRLIATQRTDLKLAWPKPSHYEKAHYELLLHYIEAHPGITFARLVHLGPIPNGKWDLNASGPFSTDFIGGNKGFPAASYSDRDHMLNAHKEYEQGFFWFLAHDPRVPQHLREEVNSWGLAKDEWMDSNHWPVQLYIREGRRMLGAYVVTEKDILQDKTKDDSIGMGSYMLDSHWVRRFEDEHGSVKVEGFLDMTIDLSRSPYEIPYRAITPKEEESDNLLVPVCLSASHVAICTIRMEPVYMILGQAAGDAALLALQSVGSVQQINIAALRHKLVAEGQIMSVSQKSPKP